MSRSWWRRLNTYHPLEYLEKEKKTQLTGHGPIKVYIYIKEPSSCYKALLVGDERGSKILI